MKPTVFTLIEHVVAIGLTPIFITSASQIFGQIYLAQKKIETSQNLYDESRFLMERLTKIMRENTIDYDQYFVEVGPSVVDCASFDSRQTPNGSSNTNNLVNRTALGYPSIFYWDTNNNGNQDTNLGGYSEDLGASDPCTIAFSGVQTTLFLINSNRTVRTSIEKNADGRIVVQRKLGADVNGDGSADFWSDTTNNFSGDICQIENPLSTGSFYDVLGDETSETFCETAHEPTIISPQVILAEEITFHSSPNRDPFLSFRVPESRIHPNTFISIKISLKNPTRYNFSDTDRPWILLQTVVSSRLFGNTRK